jgi:hypothetical protein
MHPMVLPSFHEIWAGPKDYCTLYPTPYAVGVVLSTCNSRITAHRPIERTTCRYCMCMWVLTTESGNMRPPESFYTTRALVSFPPLTHLTNHPYCHTSALRVAGKIKPSHPSSNGEELGLWVPCSWISADCTVTFVCNRIGSEQERCECGS